MSLDTPESSNTPSVEYFGGGLVNSLPDTNLNHSRNSSLSLLSVAEVDGVEHNNPNNEGEEEEETGIKTEVHTRMDNCKRITSLARSGFLKENSSGRACSNSISSFKKKTCVKRRNSKPQSTDTLSVFTIVNSPLLQTTTIQAFFFLACCYAQEHFRGRLYSLSTSHTLLNGQAAFGDPVKHPIEAPTNSNEGQKPKEAVENKKYSYHSVVQAEAKVLLDPQSTSLFNTESCDTSTDFPFWEHTEKLSLAEPASPCVFTEIERDQEKEKVSENETETAHMGRLSCHGNAAVGKYFRTAIQTCYAIEDTLRRFSRENEHCRSSETGANYFDPSNTSEGNKILKGYGTRKASQAEMRDSDALFGRDPQFSSHETSGNKFDGPKASLLASSPSISLEYFKQQIEELSHKQCQGRHSEQDFEENQRSFLQLQELNYLVTDAVQYALLLTQLQSAAPSSSGLSGWRPVSGLCDCAQLPYYKYPPPLFKTSSFTSGTIRLLEWLRTWRPQPEAPTKASFTKNGKIRNKNKRNRTQDSVKFHANTVGALQKQSLKNLKDASLPSTTQLKVEDCTLKTEAAVTETVEGNALPDLSVMTDTERVKKMSVENEAYLNSREIGKGTAAKGQQGASLKRYVSDSLPDSCNQALKFVKTEKIIPERDLVVSDRSTTLSTTMPFPQSHCVSAQEAYKRYCQLWRGTSYETLPSSRPRISGEIMHACSGSPSWPASPSPVSQSVTSRVCASLPFFKEIRKEEETLALGTICGTYVDAFGNRLRSARLARLEALRRTQRRLVSRKRSKRRGYFTREDTEEDIDLLDKANINPMSSDFSLPFQQQQRTLHFQPAIIGPSLPCDKISDRGSHCLPSSSSSSSETLSSNVDSEIDLDDGITNIAVLSGPTGSGKTASVYLAAELLGFHVVEMNNSVQRSPKNVEHLLAELTRSHRLKRSQHGKSTVSIEEELSKMKREHTIMMKATNDAVAARLAKQKVPEKRRANGISSQAVASFFGLKALSKDEKENNGVTATSTAVAQSTTQDPAKQFDALSVNPSQSIIGDSVGTYQIENVHFPRTVEGNDSGNIYSRNVSKSSGPTLLLIEDADILLGNEALKPFYAAIRDLAKKSKVPLVVTVSADAQSSGSRQTASKEDTLASNRYDLEETTAHLSSILHSHRVHVNSVADTGNHHENVISYLTEADSYLYGDEKPITQISESNHGNGCGFTRVAMSAALVAQYFGKQTPFMTLKPMSKAALFTELLVIGSVELGLLKLFYKNNSSEGENLPKSSDSMPPNLNEEFISSKITSVGTEFTNRNSNRPASEATEGMLQECTLELCDVERFEELSARLREEIYGKDLSQFVCSPSCPENQPFDTLEAAVVVTKTMHGNTDIRNWLNRLHWLLLGFRSKGTTRAVSGKPLEGHAVAAADFVNCKGSDLPHNALTHRSRGAELVEKKFRSAPWQEAALWDTFYGRYQAAVIYNELHCPRQERWSKQHLLTCSKADILVELDTCDLRLQTQEQEEIRTSASYSPPLPQFFLSHSPASPVTSLSSDLSAASISLTTVPIASAADEVAPMVSNSGIYGGAGLLYHSADKNNIDLVGLKPIDVLLPYGDAQRWLQVLNEHKDGGTDPQASCSIPSIPPRPVTRVASSLPVGGQSEGICRPQTTVPMTNTPTTKQRANRLEGWWKRTRKREATKNYVFGRSAHVYEDLLGVTSLLFPPSSTMSTLLNPQ